MGSLVALLNHRKYQNLSSLNEKVSSNLNEESLRIFEMAILDVKLENESCNKDERFDVNPFEYAVNVYRKAIH